MTEAFDDRIVRVGIDIDGETQIYDSVRIHVRGTKWRSAIMSQCEIRIFNLSREHQRYILTKASPISRPPAELTPIKVSLDIGRESYGTFRLFEGAVFQGGVGQPPDIGILLYSLTNNFQLAMTTAVSLPAYATLRQIVKQAASAMGLTPLLLSKDPERLIGNYSFTGSPQRNIEKLNQMGVIAYIDKTVLIVTDPNQPRSEGVRLINDANGMVGVPQPTAYGCIVKVMIDNSIEIGGMVEVKSEQNPACDGKYIVQKMEFEAANRDEPFWYTLDCINPEFYTGTLG